MQFTAYFVMALINCFYLLGTALAIPIAGPGLFDNVLIPCGDALFDPTKVC